MDKNKFPKAYKINHTPTDEIQYHIDAFRRLTPRKATQEEIHEIIKKIIGYMPFYIYINVGNSFVSKEFFRVRVNKRNEKFRSVSDFWNPPPAVTKQNRLNKAGEPIFYLCSDSVTTIHETKIKIGDIFNLMFYRYKPESQLEAMALNFDLNFYRKQLVDFGFTRLGLTNFGIVNDFIRKEIIQDVGKGTEYLYNISNAIISALDTEKKEKAFVYSSTYNYSYKNLAVKPEYVNSSFDFTGCSIFELISFSTDGENVKLRPLYHHKYVENEEIIYTKQKGDGNLILKMNDSMFSNDER